MTRRSVPSTFALAAILTIAGCVWQQPVQGSSPAAAPAVTPAKTSEALGCTDPVAELYERVSPSVVSISAVEIGRSGIDNNVSLVQGSGFIISDDGLVLTNSHVVFDRQAIAVTLDDGRRVEAKLIGADPIYDLAVLGIAPPREGAAKALMGNSDAVRIGEDVVAIGNPLALEQTLTRGVVSGLNRFVSDSPISLTLPLIQTDAPINPGNSGGPLFNRCGEVIGITTVMISEAQNIGFAVPINIVRKVIPELVQHGRVIRPWFGMNVRFISKELMHIVNLPLVEGLLVQKVDSGSPAQQAGIRGGSLPMTIAGEQFLLGGDIIVKMNGQPPNDSRSFAELVSSLKPGDTVRLTLYREKQMRQVAFTLLERPILPGDFRPNASTSMLGMGSRHTDSRPRPPGH